MTEAASAPDRKPRRRGLALALILVATMLAFAAILALWANRQVLNTDNWTKASSQMLESPAVQSQLSAYLVDELYANVDVEAQIREALPPRLQPLAGPAAGLLRDRIELRAKQLLARPETQELWEDANRRAHTALMRVIDGDVESVELDVKELLERTEEQAGIGGRVAGALPDGAATITIIEADQLDGVQAAGKALKSLPIVLVVLSLALFGAALAAAPGWRRQAVRATAWASSWPGRPRSQPLRSRATRWSERWRRQRRRNRWSGRVGHLHDAAGRGRGRDDLLRARDDRRRMARRPVGLGDRGARNLAPYLREPALAYGAFAVLAAIVVLWWSPTPAMRNPVTAVVLIVLSGARVRGTAPQDGCRVPGCRPRGRAAAHAARPLPAAGISSW